MFLFQITPDRPAARLATLALALTLTAALCLMCAIDPAIAQSWPITPSTRGTQSKQSTQTGQAAANNTQVETPLPAWDVTGLLGWRGVRMVMRERPYDQIDYDSRFLGGILIGRHWTPHVKTEVEIGTTAPSEVFSFSEVGYDLPGLTYQPYIHSNHRIRDTVFSAAGLYQFGVDAWFHPHLGAGIEVARTRDEIITTRQTFTPGPSLPPIVIAEDSYRSDTSVTTRFFVTTGFKAYASERVFVRTDFRVAAAGQKPANVSIRFGAGFDF